MSQSHPEDQVQTLGPRLNWLRAGVLGANDGIVSVAGIVVGVVGATSDRLALVSAGFAGLAAGAMSMAVGEYVSVSTQRDTERAALDLERWELRERPHEELTELTGLLETHGIEPELAHQVAAQLTERDALAAHAHWELGIDSQELTNPWQAAGASFVAFVVGAAIPLIAVLLAPTGSAVAVTVIAVVVALAITGTTAADLGRAPRLRAVLRNVAGGLAAMGVTYLIGLLVGSQL